MNLLQQLGMQPHWIYEVVVTTRGHAGPNAAPIGVWTEDGQTLCAALYKGSATHTNILKRREFVVNLADGPLMLHAALHRRETLGFKPAKGIDAPVLSTAESWLEMRLADLSEAGGKTLIQAEVTGQRLDGPITLINRAPGLFLESLVLSTRAHLMPGGQAEAQLRENLRVIAKVAPGSAYVQAMQELLDSL
jgi:hypothetical protein